MTTAIVKHQFEDHSIGQREQDGYVNLTQLCKAGGKKVSHYMLLDSTKELLSALAVDAGITATSDSNDCSPFVEVIQGGSKAQGTWAHPEVAIDCAQWVSVKLRIWANRTLVKIISGGSAPQPDDNLLQSQLSQLTQVVTNLSLSVARLVERNHKPLPKATVDPVPGEIQGLTERQCINKLIRNYCYHKNQNLVPGEEKKTEQEVTRWMYRELKYRYNFDVCARFKNCEGKYKNKISLIEAEGYLPQLHSICNHFLGN